MIYRSYTALLLVTRMYKMLREWHVRRLAGTLSDKEKTGITLHIDNNKRLITRHGGRMTIRII